MANTPQQPENVSYAAYDGNGEASSGMNQTPAFFLANYRLGKTLGNGSFGKVIACLHTAILVAEMRWRTTTCPGLTFTLLLPGQNRGACPHAAQGGHKDPEQAQDQTAGHGREGCVLHSHA